MYAERIPDLTRHDGGVGYCKRLALARKPGRGDLFCEAQVIYEIDPGDVDVELPDLLEHARGVLLAALEDRGNAKVQHDPGVKGFVELFVMVDGERQRLCAGAPGLIKRVVLHADHAFPRVVWTVQLRLPPTTAGLLVSMLESTVDVRFEPGQGDLFVGSAVSVGAVTDLSDTPEA